MLGPLVQSLFLRFCKIGVVFVRMSCFHFETFESGICSAPPEVCDSDDVGSQRTGVRNCVGEILESSSSLEVSSKNF